MACIDIFAPERVLSVPFLMEQIWLDYEGTRFKAIEVYDFLLQADDDKPLSEFYIASPHFCQEKTAKGQWVNTAKLTQVRSKDSGWGWFYLKPEVLKNSSLTMVVANPYPLEDHRPTHYKGIDVQSKDVSLEWHEDLNDARLKSKMVEMRKSLFKVKLKYPLNDPNRHNDDNDDNDDNTDKKDKMWFRLIVIPALLDIPAPRRPWSRSMSEKLLPFFSVSSFISCPSTVRRLIEDNINEMRGTLKINNGEPDNLQSTLVDKGFGAPGTTTRIIDHRIVLSTLRGFHVSLHGNPSTTVAYLGAQTSKVRLPKWSLSGNLNADDGNNKDHNELTEITSLLHNWLTGSYRNMRNDLVCVVETLRGELDYAGALTKNELVSRILNSCYREGCVLVDKLVELHILELVNGYLHISNDDYARKLCDLRRNYADPKNFIFFPNARQVFTDSHVFRLDLTCSWVVESIWRWTIIILVFIGSPIAIIQATISLILWWYK